MMEPIFLLNIMFLKRTIFVRLLLSFADVIRYSHDRIAKNRAPINSQQIAISLSELAKLIIFRRTKSGNAFCFFTAPSSFLYPLSCS